MDDIWRYKVFHLEEGDDPEKAWQEESLSDCVKRAAYFTKWIVKHRPIYHHRASSDIDPDDRTLVINELFAINVGLTTLATALNVQMIQLDPEYFSELMYDLHYRQLSDDALLHIYSVIRNSVEGRPPIMKVLADD